MSLLGALAAGIGTVTGKPFVPVRCDETGGGCINKTVIVDGQDGRRYFAKFNDAARVDMFQAEFEGLHELERTRAIRVPQPICVGNDDGQAFLVLEYLELCRDRATTQQRLGQQLSVLHRTTQTRFGWHRDNTIGSTPQSNDWSHDWIEFYRERRLRAQLDRAAERGETALRARGERLLERVTDFFTDYRSVPSLLHGDLWGGNVGALRDGEPAIFDPAVYFGDREADIAMTELFGGFTGTFYDAYREAWPLDAGYRVRKQLYNLYHIVNHFNLFGGGYGTQAHDMIERLLSELY
ncbi:MAG TPA: fructosamine kinase family protein [Burkholderiales bacterium]|nr:fructosamine kinase family protein [Burkholderiales bacterium]